MTEVLWGENVKQEVDSMIEQSNDQDDGLNERRLRAMINELPVGKQKRVPGKYNFKIQYSRFKIQDTFISCRKTIEHIKGTKNDPALI